MPGSERFHFGGGATGTFLSPFALVAMLFAIVFILLLPRKSVIIPVLLIIFLIPMGQEIYLGGFHVFILRIILVAAWIRILMRSSSQKDELLVGGWNPIDSAFMLFVVCHVVAFSLFFRAGGAVANQAGYALDYLGSYFLLRHLIRDDEDIVRTIKCFAFLVLVLSVTMMGEQLTGENIFGFIGGGTVTLVSAVREGHIRSQATFQHALLAGTFGATLVPLFLWLWKSGKSQILAVAAVIGATVMVLTSASSTTVLTLAAVIGALMLWPLRKQMRMVRWGIVLGIVALAAVMKAPVWFLIAHLGVVGGSSGSHRAELLDTFIRHFGEWWLLGTDSNSGWGYYMDDSSNAYVEAGVTGGLLTLIFFLLTITRAFKQVGIARKAVGDDRTKEWSFWLLGVAVFSHVVAFFGVTYFDQTKILWFALLAIIGAATAGIIHPATESAASEPSRLEFVGVPLLKAGSPKPEFIGQNVVRR